MRPYTTSIRVLTIASLLGLVLRAQQPLASSSAALFEKLPEIEAASLHTHSLEDAPASVTVVTAEQIRRYGYRTLSDVLASVRGLYMSYDHIYQSAGVRGFSLPGDFNTRFLVMLNGHPLTDNIYDSNGFFGQDLGIDMDLVSRIEIVRGPTSALYGSNGIFANVNIITRSPAESETLRVSTETGSLGEKKAFLASSTYLGRGANLLVSASAFTNSGQGGDFDGSDGEKGYHSFTNLVWRDWSFSTYFYSREKQVPIPWGDGAVPFHRGDSVRDGTGFVRAVYSYTAASGGRIRWEASYDQYRYHDRFDYPDAGGLQDVRSVALGDWLATQGTYEFNVPHLGVLTAGGQLQLDLRNFQQDYTVAPVPSATPEISHPDWRQAVFAEQEIKLGARSVFYVGLRLDHTRHFGEFLSPRLALVHRRSPGATYKFVFGRPFRNPSVFERFYNDGGASFLASPGLRPEVAQTFDVSMEHKLGGNASLTVDAYHYRLNRMIAAVFLPGDVEQYQNGDAMRSTGVEVEAAGKPRPWLEAAASLAVQRSITVPGEATLANSPRYLAKFRAAVPVWNSRIWLSSSWQYMSERLTRNGGHLRPVLLGDFTVSTSRLHPSFDLVAGARNLANWRYSDPAALALDSILQPGRSIFLKLIWHARQ